MSWIDEFQLRRFPRWGCVLEEAFGLLDWVGLWTFGLFVCFGVFDPALDWPALFFSFRLERFAACITFFDTNRFL
jgi:hypothetical protein